VCVCLQVTCTGFRDLDDALATSAPPCFVGPVQANSPTTRGMPALVLGPLLVLAEEYRAAVDAMGAASPVHRVWPGASGGLRFVCVWGGGGGTRAARVRTPGGNGYGAVIWGCGLAGAVWGTSV
jgi:hypothetical protein